MRKIEETNPQSVSHTAAEQSTLPPSPQAPTTSLTTSAASSLSSQPTSTVAPQTRPPQDYVTTGSSLGGTYTTQPGDTPLAAALQPSTSNPAATRKAKAPPPGWVAAASAIYHLDAVSMELENNLGIAKAESQKQLITDLTALRTQHRKSDPTRDPDPSTPLQTWLFQTARVDSSFATQIAQLHAKNFNPIECLFDMAMNIGRGELGISLSNGSMRSYDIVTKCHILVELYEQHLAGKTPEEQEQVIGQLAQALTAYHMSAMESWIKSGQEFELKRVYQTDLLKIPVDKFKRFFAYAKTEQAIPELQQHASSISQMTTLLEGYLHNAQAFLSAGAMDALIAYSPTARSSFFAFEAVEGALKQCAEDDRQKGLKKNRGKTILPTRVPVTKDAHGNISGNAMGGTKRLKKELYWHLALATAVNDAIKQMPEAAQKEVSSQMEHERNATLQCAFRHAIANAEIIYVKNPFVGRAKSVSMADKNFSDALTIARAVAHEAFDAENTCHLAVANAIDLELEKRNLTAFREPKGGRKPRGDSAPRSYLDFRYHDIHKELGAATTQARTQIVEEYCRAKVASPQTTPDVQKIAAKCIQEAFNKVLGPIDPGYNSNTGSHQASPTTSAVLDGRTTRGESKA